MGWSPLLVSTVENDPRHTRLEGCRTYEQAQAPSLRAEVLSRAMERR